MIITLTTSAYYLKRRPFKIDNSVFFLHYGLTCLFLIFFSELTLVLQYGLGKSPGDLPINCLVDTTSFDSSIMDTYCWVTGTYTVQKCTRKGEAIYPGVSQSHGVHGQVVVPGDKIKRHVYYQWVVILHFVMGLCFYVPHYLWKTWEDGHIKMLVGNLVNSPVMDRTTRTREKDMVVQYLTKNIGFYNTYFFAYCLCETLNLANVLLQIFLLDVIFGLKFPSFGQDILGHISGSTIGNASCADPMRGMDTTFPTMSKCTFKKVGPSGSLIPHDGLCVLPINIFNQQVYSFLWIWFLVVATVTAMSLVYRLSTVFFPNVRLRVMESNLGHSTVSHVEFEKFSKFGPGDWFIMHQLAKNLDPVVYNEILTELIVTV